MLIKAAKQIFWLVWFSSVQPEDLNTDFFFPPFEILLIFLAKEVSSDSVLTFFFASPPTAAPLLF